MGEFINICAGADNNSIPESPVEAVLFNVIDHCISPRKINAAMEMYRLIQPKYSMLDSSGYHVLKADLASKRLSFNRINSEELTPTPKFVLLDMLFSSSVVLYDPAIHTPFVLPYILHFSIVILCDPASNVPSVLPFKVSERNVMKEQVSMEMPFVEPVASDSYTVPFAELVSRIPATASVT